MLYFIVLVFVFDINSCLIEKIVEEIPDQVFKRFDRPIHIGNTLCWKHEISLHDLEQLLKGDQYFLFANFIEKDLNCIKVKKALTNSKDGNYLSLGIFSTLVTDSHFHIIISIETGKLSEKVFIPKPSGSPEYFIYFKIESSTKIVLKKRILMESF